MTNATLHDALRTACADVGIAYRDVPADGRWHETDVEGDPRGRGDGRIKVFPDGEGGIAWNWKGEARPFFADDGRKLTEAERRERERKRQDAIHEAKEEETRRHAEAAKKAAAIWKAATPARADHPYLSRKQVSPTATLREIAASAAATILGYAPRSSGELLSGRLLVAPVKIGNGLSTLELIDGDGRKSAIAGGAKAGAYWAAQPLPDGSGSGQTLLIGEGVATVLSAKEATGRPSIAALSASNLPAVARAMRERYPGAALVILADLVKTTGEPDHYAIEAAKRAGGKLAVPDFAGDRADGATDFNDMAALCSAEAVGRAIANAASPAGGERQPGTDSAGSGDSDGWPEPLPLAAKIASQPYPFDALPDAIRGAVEEVHGFTKAPIPLVASSALGALSLATQAHANVQRAEGLSGPTSLFLLTIADSGERKSTCDSFFTQAIRDYDVQRAEEAKPAQAEYRAALVTWEAKQGGIKEKIRQLAKGQKPTGEYEAALRDLERERPRAPRVPRLIYGDATPEALKWGLAMRWPSGGVISAEGGLVFGAHGMNKESIMRNLATLNELWDAKPICTERRTSESFTVRGARLTIALQVQEATVRGFFDKSGGLARGSGFLARFLVAWPESTQGTRAFTDPPSSWPALASFNRRIAAILDQPAPIDDEGALSPSLLMLSSDAKAAWIAFHDAIEGELRTGGELYDVRDVASKSADNAARLAALFHWFGSANSNGSSSYAISAEHLEAASRVIAWHLNESRRFFGELALPVELANAVRLDSWLMDYCRRVRTLLVPIKKVQQFGPGGLRDKAAIESAIRELEELSRARLVQDGRRRIIKVNPSLIEWGMV